jgi:uncharacterized membrane protein
MKLIKISTVQLLCAVLLLLFSVPLSVKAEPVPEEYIPVKARVLEVFQKSEVQEVRLEILEGSFTGQEITLPNVLTLSQDKYLLLKARDQVLVFINRDEAGNMSGGYIHEYVREKHLLYLTGAFVFLLIAIGGFKGMKAVLTLVITGAAILKVFLPAILSGKSPVNMSILICAAVTVICLSILNGFSRKSLIAIVGTIGGILAAGILSRLMIAAARLSGFGGEETYMLSKIPQNINFNFRGLLFAGIIMGALGAVMDISMSIASALHEIKEKNPGITSGELWLSGMNVGKDTMGTMANTLILAYTGGSLNMLLIFMAYGVTLSEIINSQEIASEVIRALAGSIGLILSVPITVLCAIILYRDGAAAFKQPPKYYYRK